MESLCNGEEIWDSDLIWNNNRTWPEFTECFQNTVLLWLPSGWLWLTAPVYVIYLLRLPVAPLTKSWMGWTKELLTVFQLLLLLTKLVLTNDVLWATYLGIVVESATLDFETLETPTVLFFAYFFLSIGQLVLNCSSEPVLETLETMRKPCPMSTASFLSRVTFSWMNSLLKLGYIRPLTGEEVFVLNSSEQSKDLVPYPSCPFSPFQLVRARLLKLGYIRSLTDEDVFMLNPSEQSNAVGPVFEAIWDNEKKKLQKAIMPKNETSWRTLCPSQLWKREHTEEEKQPLLSDCSGEKQPLLSDCSGNLLNRNENTTCDDKKSQPKTAAKHGANKTSVKPGVSLFKVLWKTFGMYNVVGMLCNFVNTCLSFLQPVLLK